MNIINWFGKQIQHEGLPDTFTDIDGWGPHISIHTEKVIRMIPHGDLYRKESLWQARLGVGHRRHYKEITCVEDVDLGAAIQGAVTKYLEWRKGE